MKLADLAQAIGAELRGPADIEIRGVAGISEAGDGDVTFLSDMRRTKELVACKASAVIVPQELSQVPLPALAVGNPRYAFAQALRLFNEQPYAAGGVSDRAVVEPGVTIGADPTVHPFVVIGAGAVIGDRVTLHAGVSVEADAVIGNDCILYANVTVRTGVRIGDRVILHPGAVIGSDGFSFVTDGGKHHKIPQVGGVIIEDDVEIGANTTVDRATLGNTVIRKGTKIDNQVQIAHNVTIGEHCLMAAQTGVAGSSSLGQYVVLGGQAGVADHIRVGDRVMAGGGSAITRDVEAGQVVAGHNAMPLRDWLKVQVMLPKLPDLKRQIAQLLQRISELEKKS